MHVGTISRPKLKLMFVPAIIKIKTRRYRESDCECENTDGHLKFNPGIEVMGQ